VWQVNFLLLLIGQQDFTDFARNWIFICIGWEDLQIVCQLMGKMTNSMPTSLCLPPAAGRSAFIIGKILYTPSVF
jgi:hypothetical protein